MRLVNKRGSAGFTLIEILIAVAVVAILATVAYPSYAAAVRKAHRSEAQGYLLQLYMRQNQYFYDARSYATNVGALGVTPPVALSSYYNVTISNPASAPPAFTITAAAIGSQAPDGDLSIDQTGARTPSAKW